MNLFHYTTHEYWPSIERLGLDRGEVPLSATELMNGVWLTSDPSPAGHGLTDGEIITPEMARQMNIDYEQGMRFPNKREVRIEVRIPRNDRRLVSWSKWAPKHLAPSWQDVLEKTGGGRAKAKMWFIYWGVIPPDWFRKKIDLLLA